MSKLNRRVVYLSDREWESLRAEAWARSVTMSSLVRVKIAPRGEPVEIRATHPAGFRSGQWATVISLEWAKGRMCWRVEFPDGRQDSWVVDDPSDPYEFRAKAVTPVETSK